jgi:hypothetical protein
MKLKDQWIEDADKDLDRTPEEIKLAEPAATSAPEEIPGTEEATEAPAEPAEAPSDTEVPVDAENGSV